MRVPVVAGRPELKEECLRDSHTGNALLLQICLVRDQLPVDMNLEELLFAYYTDAVFQQLLQPRSSL